jgi:L-ascorbate metabolism protein UlaG (beta-lactamase superfamily)
MVDSTVRLAPGARLALQYAAPERECEIDCRLLFLGGRQGALERAYGEVSRLLAESPDPDVLLGRLQACALAQTFYEARRTDAGVAVDLREAVYGGALASLDLEFTLRVWRDRRAVTRAVPALRLRAVGHLWPLLLGDRGEEGLVPALEAALSGDDATWAMDLYVWLRACGAIARGSPPSNRFSGPGPRPRVTFLGHSSLLVQSTQASVVFDPLLRTDWTQPRSTFDVCRLGVGAICCSHSHWDHFNPQTLLWFDKRTPVIVPRVRHPSVFNPPMVGVLALLGFTDVREVDPGDRVHIGDIEIVALPFYGEQDEPGEEIDHFTYLARTTGLTVFGGVDCFRDTFGDTKDQCDAVRDRYHPDVAFLPVSRMVYHVKWGGPSAFRRHVDTGCFEDSFQYTAGPEDAAEWAARLQARRVVPYATFTLARVSESREAWQFWRALRRRGLGAGFCPLPPLGTLDARHVREGFSSKRRRLQCLGWFGLSRALAWLGGWVGSARRLRRLPKVLRRFAGDPIGATRALGRRPAA